MKRQAFALAVMLSAVLGVHVGSPGPCCEDVIVARIGSVCVDGTYEFDQMVNGRPAYQRTFLVENRRNCEAVGRGIYGQYGPG